MKNFLIAMLSGFAGYILLACLSYFLIGKFSSNSHDRSMEAGMTSIFVAGPIGLVVGIIVGYVWVKDWF
ncbi:hypothetical protein [Dyadobacter sp. CY326]|uniref:hypothetical protein n=1 Tax=Dyadobacter sp. CY326 TaxID=2907300 RepID=UPI001F31ED4C|nr:hypothetical protein [Dyadobacter sp. CY326]MCE7066644.1 hypothetical protein [Dyadobacter sp. CY326]